MQCMQCDKDTLNTYFRVSLNREIVSKAENKLASCCQLLANFTPKDIYESARMIVRDSSVEIYSRFSLKKLFQKKQTYPFLDNIHFLLQQDIFAKFYEEINKESCILTSEFQQLKVELLIKILKPLFYFVSF